MFHICEVSVNTSSLLLSTLQPAWEKSHICVGVSKTAGGRPTEEGALLIRA